MKILKLSLMLVVCTLAGTAFADEQGGPPGGGQGGPQGGGGGQHHGGPPPEALAACKGLSIGAKAQMKSPRGDTMSGTCQLVLVPDHRSGGNEGGNQGGNQSREMPPPQQ